MGKPEIVTGTLINDRTVALSLPLQPMKVRVAMEPLDEKQLRLYRPEVISKIPAAQAAHGP